jgi:hypothetical protein
MTELRLGLEPSRPSPFFPGHMQLAPQTVDKLQNAAGFGFDNRLHYQLATAVENGDHHRFLVHVHADILEIATHVVASTRLSESPVSDLIAFALSADPSHRQNGFARDCCLPRSPRRKISLQGVLAKGK